MRGGCCGPRGPRRGMSRSVREVSCGRRLVLEEVEIDVGVVFGHGGRFCRKKSAHSTGSDGRRRIPAGQAKPQVSWPRRRLPFPPASSLPSAIGPCARSAAAAPARSGWRATSAPGLDVALKIVPREGKAATRAEREALAAARLRHERCLRAYGLDRDSRNVYIAYEYVPGQTMREALRAGELDDAAAVETAAQVLEGLAHAHARGIVHRDVKPSNVLLAEGEELSARLLDFGLAQLAEEESLTATGDVPGTLAYVPPERLVHGESGGPPADIWAVGAMLWESLAGWHPFWNGSLLETAKRIETGAAPLAQARPDLPKPLCALVDRMLSLDPAARPPAAHLAHELRDTFAERLRRRKTRTTVPELSVPLRLAAPAAAALFAGWTAAEVRVLPDALRAAARADRRRADAGAAADRARLHARGARAAARKRLVRARARLRRRRRARGWRSPGGRRARGSSSRSARCSRRLLALGLLPLAAQAIRNPVRRALPGRGGRAARGRGGRPAARGAALHRRRAAEGPRDRRERRRDRRRRGARPRPAVASRRSCSRQSCSPPPRSPSRYVRERGLWWIAGLGAALIAAALAARARRRGRSARARGLGHLHRPGAQGPGLEFRRGA